MPERLISLTVGTKEAEEWFRTFQDISELAINLADSHHFVEVSTCVATEMDDDVYPAEDLYHDENTLFKVRQALLSALPGLTDQNVIDAISEMGNVGILFREQPRDEPQEALRDIDVDAESSRS